LTISILGDGDAKRIKSPDLNLPPSFQLYDTKSEEEERGENEGKKFSQKSFTYIIQPQKEGEFSFQPTFTYFYPLSDKYETKLLDPILLKISAGQAVVNVKKEENRNFIPLTKNDFQTTSSLNNILWILGFTLPFLSTALLYLNNYRNKKEKIQSPFEITMNHFLQAKIYGTNGNYENCFIELSFGLRTFLFHHFDIPKENISNDQIINILKEKGFSNQDTIHSLSLLLNRFEMVLYAPSMKKDHWESTWKEVTELVNQLK
jgi:hypothetical protein